MTEGWICEGGHPYYLVDGEKMCPICIKIADVGSRPKRCRVMGHLVPADQQWCTLCQRYTKLEWLRELDKTGTSTCPQGHEATHETLKYSLRSGKFPERKCEACVSSSWKKANTAYIAKRMGIAQAEGRELQHRPKEKRRLAPEYFDWVVALRLIEGKIDEVYDMRRGTHVGATGMERWVAYHSTTDDYNYMRTTPSGPTHVRSSWVDTGKVKRWKPKTLAQAMSEL